MTKLGPTSSVTRETLAQYRRRPLIVELSGHNVSIREKGKRDRVLVPLLAIYDLGLKLRARELLEAKRGKR
jgi:hypothetical protein